MSQGVSLRLAGRGNKRWRYCMSEFWYTVYTMKDVYGSDYTSFTLFSPTHIFWLVLLVVICVVCAILYRRASEQKRLIARRVLSAFILLTEVTRQRVIISAGQWIPAALPLHLCSVNIFVCLWYTIHPTKVAGNILYCLCLPGALVALLSPTWLALPINNICHITSELLHISLVLYPVLLLAGGFRPQPRMIPKVLACLAGAAVVIYPINKLLGTNFFFINGYEDNVITELFASIFGEQFYLVGFIFVIAILLVVLYLPWYLSDKKRAKAK